MSDPLDEHRVRIRVNPPTSENLRTLQGFGMTVTDAIRESVSLYVFALRNRKGGRKLVTMNPDGTDVVEIM